MEKDFEYADISNQTIEKIKELEEDISKNGEDVILLAYKNNKTE